VRDGLCNAIIQQTIGHDIVRANRETICNTIQRIPKSVAIPLPCVNLRMMQRGTRCGEERVKLRIKRASK